MVVVAGRSCVQQLDERTPDLNTNISMTAISNRNVMSTVERFEYVVSSGSRTMHSIQQVTVDAAVLTEAYTMRGLSARCNHTAASGTVRLPYERDPKEKDKIESRFGSVNAKCTSTANTHAKTGSNAVASTLLCALSCIVEFSDMHPRMNGRQCKILITDVMY